MRTRALRAVLGLALLAGLAGSAEPAASGDRGVRQEWIEVPSGSWTLRAAVVRPADGKAAPLVVVLHGRSGFRPSFLSLAQAFAGVGYVAIAGCWFGGSGHEPPPADLVACPNAPPFRGANLDSIEAVRALIAAGRELPGVQGDRVGLFGHSLGATASLLVASTSRDVSAVVASAPRTTEPASTKPPNPPLITLVDGVAAPVLLLQGTADETVPVQEAREYEQALRQRGKPVESHYYDGAAHDIPFLPATAADVFQRSVAFFDKYLKPAGTSADTTAPTVSLRVAPGQRLATVAASGLRVSVGCSEACSIELALTLGGADVGAGSGQLSAAGTAEVVAKLTSAGRKKLRGLSRATLILTARVTDAAGNVRSETRTLTLRR